MKAAALQLHQMRQKLGTPLHMKNKTRHVTFSCLCHKGLTPEAQQRFSTRAHLVIGKDEGNSLAQAAPVRLPYFLVVNTGGDLGLYGLLP